MVVRIGQKSARPRQTFFKEWREFRGLSQEQLAERLECGKSAVSKLETGKTKYNQSNLEAWADALSTTPDELLRPPPTDDRPDIARLFQSASAEAQRIVTTILRTGTDG